MKYGVIPTSLFERLALWSGHLPIPVVDCVYGLMKARALMTGVRLGIFERLSRGARSSASLAAELSLDPPSLDQLMRALAHMDYLVLRGDGYDLSTLARRHLTDTSPQDLTGFVLWNYTQWEMIEHLDELVRTGRGVEFHDTLADPEAWGLYQRAMLELARLEAPVLAARVPVPAGARRLLDVGGGHGLHGAQICRRHPPLRATVLDLPAALPHARRLAEEEGIADVVTHEAGDLRSTEWPGEADVLLLSHLVHHFRPAEIPGLFARALHALRPGGTLAVWEMEAPKPGSPASFGDGIKLFFRIASTGGTCDGEQYARWAGDAGFTDIRTERPLASPGSVLVVGRR